MRNLRSRALALLGRLASPAGLLLAGLCFALPFLTVSCSGEEGGQSFSGSLSYTGGDLVVGGRVDLQYETRDERGVRRVDVTDLERSPGSDSPVEPIPVEPFAVAAVALLGVGVLAGLLRPAGLRRLAAGTAALVAVILLVGGTLRSRSRMGEQIAPLLSDTKTGAADMIDFGYGLWLALGLLLVVAVGNIAGSLRVPAPGERSEPAEHDPVDTGVP
jgi:hypothetical protein